MTGLYNGVAGLSGSSGLWGNVAGLWSGATGLQDGSGGPALSLNFLSGTLDSRVTFTRSTTATFVGSNGLIQTAAINTPRFDYDPVTLAAKGLLIEETRTNRTLYSENFTGASWAATVAGTSTRVNDGAPLGFTRGLITATSAGGGIRQVHSGLSSGQVYALSFYIQSTATSVVIVFENGGVSFGTVHTVTINPSAGTAGALTGFTSVRIQPFGPGYVYTLITAAAGGTLNANIEWRITNNGDSIWLGRPQFEAGAFATSYIPTVASQVTRTADVPSMTGTNFSSWYNASEGTFLVEADSFVNVTTAFVYWAAASSDGTGSNRIGPFIYNGKWGGNVRVAGVDQCDLQQNASYTANTPAKVALAYKANDFAASVNGNAALTDTSGSVPTVDRLSIGSLNAGNFINGHIRQITYYNTRLTNAQLQAITA